MSPEHILGSITEAFYVLDDGWRFSYLNAEAERLLQRPAAELIGSQVWEALPGTRDSAFHEAFTRARRENQPTTVTAYYEPLRAWYAVRAYPHPGGLSVYFQDVTGRRWAEAELERLAAVQTALRRVATTVATGAAAEEVFALVAAECARLLGADAGGILRYRGDREAVLVGMWTGGRPEFALGTVVSIDQEARLDRLRRAEQPQRFEHREGGEGIMERRGYRASAFAPVRLAGVPWGAIGVASKRAGGLPSVSEQRLADFSELVELAVANAEASAELAAQRDSLHLAEARARHHARQQSVVAALGRRGLAGGELDGLFRDAVRAVAQTLQVELVRILELRPGGDSLVMRAGVGWTAEDAGGGAVPARPPSRAGRLLSSGRPIMLDGLDEDDGEPAPDLLAHGARSGVSVVIGDLEQPFGILEAHSAERRDLGFHDAQFLESVANVLAATIERRRTDERVRHRALHDPLTDLPNRALLLDRLTHALRALERAPGQVAVLFLDVDEFKLVNDSYGHDAGDRLLRALAPRLRDAVRPTDTVARFGGDEFVVLCEDVLADGEAERLAERLRAAVAEPVELREGTVFTTASIGVATASSPATDPETLLQDADAAMYRAKDRGRNRHSLYDTGLRSQVVERLRLKGALRLALEREELRLYVQPIVSLRDGRIVAGEALLRWEHPDHGLIAPALFMPSAESSGLIVPIGRWVLEQACLTAAGWRPAAAGSAPVRLAVNLSPRQVVHSDLPALVTAALEASGLEPARLGLEITETALMAEAEASAETLRTLRALGVRILLDDFGTGYSSLAYLDRFPIDALKIDQSFVSRLDGERPDDAILAAILAMSKALGLGTIAEGLETDAQRRRLIELGCARAQGYHFARPVPAEEFARMVAEGVRLPAEGA